jgi:hypothetical protein
MNVHGEDPLVLTSFKPSFYDAGGWVWQTGNHPPAYRVRKLLSTAAPAES